MEPIKVIIVNTDNIIYQIINSPIFTFIMGTIVTVIVSFILQGKNELQNKKEKIVLIQIKINEALQAYRTLLTYLNPKFDNTPEIVFSDSKFDSDSDLSKAISNRRKEVINNSISIIHGIEDEIIPIINTFISQRNIKYFKLLFDSIHKIKDEFLEIPIMCKKVYEPDIQSMIVCITRDSFIKMLEEIFLKVYLWEKKSIQIGYGLYFNMYKNEINYESFFSKYEEKAIQHNKLVNEKEI